MSQKIFEQLDGLEKGARIQPRAREVYQDTRADYSAYRDSRPVYRQHAPEYGNHAHEQNGFEDQPMTFDSFGGYSLHP